MSNKHHHHMDFQTATLVGETLKHAESGRSCSESVMAAYGPVFGLDPGQAMKVAAGFGGGMGLMGETCGAVTAAFMVLGLAFGTADIHDRFSRQNTYLLVAEFAERFRKCRGSLICRELCPGHSMFTPEGARALRESGKPLEMVETSAIILEGLIREQNSGGVDVV